MDQCKSVKKNFKRASARVWDSKNVYPWYGNKTWRQEKAGNSSLMVSLHYQLLGD